MSAVLPSPAADEIIIEVDGPADRLGRQHFWAYWQADNVGAHCDEHGVRGQRFHGVVAEHAERWRRNHRVTIGGGS